jgi:Na+/melibiose symporter-like transporter
MREGKKVTFALLLYHLCLTHIVLFLLSIGVFFWHQQSNWFIRVYTCMHAIAVVATIPLHWWIVSLVLFVDACMAWKATIQLDIISCFFVSVVRKRRKSSYRIKEKREFHCRHYFSWCNDIRCWITALDRCVHLL